MSIRTIHVISSVGRRPIAGANVWLYEHGVRKECLGVTDANGSIQLSLEPSTKLRFEARGHAVRDRSSINSKLVMLPKIHSGAYTGFLPESTSSIWVRKGGDDGHAFEFTAFGQYRTSNNLSQLSSSVFALYMLKPEGPWSLFSTRANELIPDNDATFKYHISKLNGFQFPKPGVMKARCNDRPNKVIEYERVN